MKVHELIEKLSEINPDADVYVMRMTDVFGYKLTDVAIDDDKDKKDAPVVYLRPFSFSEIFGKSSKEAKSCK